MFPISKSFLLSKLIYYSLNNLAIVWNCTKCQRCHAPRVNAAVPNLLDQTFELSPYHAGRLWFPVTTAIAINIAVQQYFYFIAIHP